MFPVSTLSAQDCSTFHLRLLEGSDEPTEEALGPFCIPPIVQVVIKIVSQGNQLWMGQFPICLSVEGHIVSHSIIDYHRGEPPNSSTRIYSSRLGVMHPTISNPKHRPVLLRHATLFWWPIEGTAATRCVAEMSCGSGDGQH